MAGATAFLITLIFLAERKYSTTHSGISKGTAKQVIHGWRRVTNHGVLLVSLIQASQYYTYGTVEFFLVGYLNEVVKLDSLSIGNILGSKTIALIITRHLGVNYHDEFGVNSWTNYWWTDYIHKPTILWYFYFS